MSRYAVLVAGFRPAPDESPTGARLSYAQRQGAELKTISQGEREAVRVLFVEDDRSVAQMYKLKLELDGYRVDVASDGEMAVEMALRELPDIVFLDIRLPKLDGLAVLQALRSNTKTKDLRVVILSNYNPRDLSERLAKLGVLDHLIKAETTPAKLVAGLERWLKA